MESVKQTPEKNRKEINMEENEILEGNTSEKVEQTTEETPQTKTYTQEQVDEIVGRRLARNEARIRKEYDRRYGGLEDVLKAGTGKESVEEITEDFRNYYREKGVQISARTELSEDEIEVLAKHEAEGIIRAGIDEVTEEVDALAEKGAEKMTSREKALFRVLAEHRRKVEQGRELAGIGVSEDVYNSQAFRDFADRFKPGTPIRDIYGIYEKTQTKQKEIRTMGSMAQSPNSGPKDYYTPEEIERLTMEDLDDPKVWAAVRRSMTGV